MKLKGEMERERYREEWMKREGGITFEGDENKRKGSARRSNWGFDSLRRREELPSASCKLTLEI